MHLGERAAIMAVALGSCVCPHTRKKPAPRRAPASVSPCCLTPLSLVPNSRPVQNTLSGGKQHKSEGAFLGVGSSNHDLTDCSSLSLLLQQRVLRTETK